MSETDEKCAYVRIGRNAVEDVYESFEKCPFTKDRANVLKEGNDVAIIACGEMVYPALGAAKLLEKEGIQASVTDMYCIKPLDAETVLKVASKARAVVTVEEHSPFGGLGSMVASLLSENEPKKMKILSLPDSPVITGNSQQVFDHYGLNPEGIRDSVKEILDR